jgi:hypothetical protein
MEAVCSEVNTPPRIREAPLALVPILCARAESVHSRRTVNTDRRSRKRSAGDGKMAPLDNKRSYARWTGSAAPLHATSNALATSSSPTGSSPEVDLSYTMRSIIITRQVDLLNELNCINLVVNHQGKFETSRKQL